MDLQTALKQKFSKEVDSESNQPIIKDEQQYNENHYSKLWNSTKDYERYNIITNAFSHITSKVHKKEPPQNIKLANENSRMKWNEMSDYMRKELKRFINNDAVLSSKLYSINFNTNGGSNKEAKVS